MKCLAVFSKSEDVRVGRELGMCDVVGRGGNISKRKTQASFCGRLEAGENGRSALGSLVSLGSLTFWAHTI